jgi:hypothetical protein
MCQYPDKIGAWVEKNYPDKNFFHGTYISRGFRGSSYDCMPARVRRAVMVTVGILAGIGVLAGIWFLGGIVFRVMSSARVMMKVEGVLVAAVNFLASPRLSGV